jgi:hypothetical protein
VAKQNGDIVTLDVEMRGRKNGFESMITQLANGEVRARCQGRKQVTCLSTKWDVANGKFGCVGGDDGFSIG